MDWTPPTILLVEDDAVIAADLTRALATGTTGGCTVWHAESAADARAVLKHGHPDLIVLDLTLPDIDGLVFCTQLKTEAPDVPFMVCSTATTAEKVLSFKLGAEDVVGKPFELPEVEARIEAILRRRARAKLPVQAASTSSERAARDLASGAPGLGKLRVDHARWRVTLDDRPLDLTPTEFQLLAFMTRRPGEIISRPELARGVWGDESMATSRTIDAYVRRIGAKLNGRNAPRILNIRGLGYQLAAPFVTAA
ncbi:MAG TPA: response regulator transcription factor [Chloroflexota bacterium]